MTPARALRFVCLLASAGGAGLFAAPSAAVAQQAYYSQTYLSAPHNWAFRGRFPGVDALFNAFDYGHAILYETLWRRPNAPLAELDSARYGFITTSLLRHPPNVALDESAIGPNWVKLVPEVAQMFEWAHLLHRQLYDVWAYDRLTPERRDKEVARLLRYYRSRQALAFSTSPKNMNLMEGQSYSLAFRKRYPRYNGLIWSYHWLQMALYEALLAPAGDVRRRSNVDAVVTRFWEMLDPVHPQLPTVMPQSYAVAPRFSGRYPEAAIIFDNLHSLHDVVSDILADPAIPPSAKRQTILQAAARYRDTTTSITSVEDWKAMADAMGLANMGGAAPVVEETGR
ncbi:MAG: hypothetical protein QOK07_2093 [Gemmatimonadaceae bacterium]|nr:hypothetical protein [Gemmatimonadaceae bacterium]